MAKERKKTLDKEELISELRELDSQIKHMQKHIEVVDSQLMELESLKLSLSEFADTKEGDEMLVPLAAGIYVKGKLADNKELIVNVGANVSVEKKPEEVKEMLAKQSEEIKKFRASLLMQFQQLVHSVEEIQEKFE
ncbi:MAG: prefoldin subunit alpha [Nanoarchaeota archaeon]|nr:prefoldin subunit alpha [Nanoarchaeota archaeon]